MANETTAPLEGAEAPGFFSRGWALDKGLQSVDSFFEWAADVVENTGKKVITWEMNYNPVTKIENVITDFKKTWKTKEDIFSEKDIEFSNEFAQWDWIDQTKWTLKWLFWVAQNIKPTNIMGKDSMIWSGIQKKLAPWITEDAFNKWVSQFDTTIADKTKAIKDIEDTDPRFYAFRDFSKEVYEKYLKSKNLTQIQDQNDYVAFMQGELSKQDPIKQWEILAQQQELSNVTSEIANEVKQEEQKMADFINKSIKSEEWKQWIDVYNDFNKEQADKYGWNKYLAITWKIHAASTDDYEKDIANSGLQIWSLGTDYTNIREALINTRATRKGYMLQILSEWDVWAAAKFKETDEAWSRFEMEELRRLWEEKAKPENKWLSLVELSEKATALAFKYMSQEDRKLMRDQEALITSYTAYVNADEWMKRLESFNPMAIMDWVMYGMSAINGIVDQAFDYNQEVPDYIKQESRAFAYANETNLRKLWSVITHNPDAIATMLIPMKWVWAVTKTIDKFIDVAAKWTKAFKIPVKIGFTEWTLKIIPNALKGMQTSLITGAAGDAVIDNQMMQAPTSVNEAFNNAIWLFFDTNLYWISKTVWQLSWAKSSMNQLAFKYLHGDEAKAVKEWTEFYNTNYNKSWTKITEAQWRSALEASRSALMNMYSPDKVKSIFNEKWGIYRFLADNVDKMKAADIDTTVTWQGLSIEINQAMWIPKEDYRNFLSLLEINDQPKTWLKFDDVRYKVIQDRIETHLKNQEAFLTGGPLDRAVIQKAFINTPEFVSKAWKVRSLITQIRTLTQKSWSFDEIKLYADELNSEIKDMRSKYTTILEKTKITLRDINDPNQKIHFEVDIEDLKSQLDWKTFQDLLRDQRVTLEKDVGNIKAWTYDLVDSYSSAVDQRLSKFMKDIEQDIVKFESEVFPNIQWQSLRQTIKNLLSNNIVIFWALWNLKWDELKNARVKVSEFVVDIAKRYYWENNVGAKWIYHGDGLKNFGNILNDFDNGKWNINISYGSFDSTERKWEFITNFYITFGKDVVDSEVIRNALTKDLQWNWRDVTIYTKTSASMMRKIIKYWLNKDGSIDFDKWLKKVKIIESTGEKSSMFENWEISLTKINEIIDDLWIKKEEQKELSSFIQWMFKWANENDSLIIRPMVYSLVEQYARSKPLLLELFKRKWNKIKFVEWFANILIQPKLYDDMVKRMPMSEALSKVFADHADDAWLTFRTWMQERIGKAIRNAKEIKDAIPSQSSSYVKESMRQQIEILKLNAKSLSALLRKEKEFKNNIINLSKNNVNIKFLQTQANNYSLTRLLSREEPRIIPMPEAQKEKYLAIKNDLGELYAWNKWMIDQLMQDIDASEWLEWIVALQNKYAAIDFKNDKLKNLTNSILDIWFYKWDGIEIVDENIFKKTIDSLNWLYDYQYAKDNNPLAKKLSAWLSNANSGRDDVLEKRIAEYFWSDENISSYELYHTNVRFAELVDSLYASNYWNIIRSDWGLPKLNYKIPKVAKAKVENFIREVFAWTEIFTTNKSKPEISGELINDTITDQKIINKLKSIKNFRINKNERNIKLNDEWNFNKSFSYSEWAYNENILQLDNMGDSVKIMRWFSVKQAKYLTVGAYTDKRWVEKYATLWNLIKTETYDRFIKSKNPNDAYVTDTEVYLEAVNTINWTWNRSQFTDSFRNQLGLERWEVWVGNFGDKDSVYTTYKLDPKYTPFTWEALWDNAKIVQALYKYDYAFANGYVLPSNNTILTFDAWYKEVIWDQKFTSFEQFVEHVEKNSYTNNGKLENKYILSRDKIRKREAFNMSTRNTFEDYVVDTATYIIEKKIDEIPELTPYLVNWKYNLSIEDIDSAIAQDSNKNLTEILSAMKKWHDDWVFNIVDINNAINLIFRNDLQDGTSFVSHNLVKIRAEIVGGKKWLREYSEYTLEEWEEDITYTLLRNQFKDHYYGGEKRFWAKTLFTWSKIEVDWKELDNAVVIGESSMKLEWGYTKFAEGEVWVIPEKDINWNNTGRFYKNVTINGKPYRSFWYVPKTDTSYFKNAESDSYKKVEEVTVSDSIKARVWIEYSLAIEEIQKQQIIEEFERTMWELTQYRIATNSYWSVVDQIRLLSSNIKMGIWTDAVVKWKVSEMITKMNNIIAKPKDGWSTLYIQESSLKVWPNEILVSNTSKLYKSIIDKMEAEIKALPEGDARIQTIKDDIKNWNIYTVGYRYPVPSQYNLGLFKVRVIESEIKEFPEYADIGSDAVITSPFPTYIKFEWDHDGDGITFLPIRDGIGKVLANALLRNKPDADVVIPNNFMNDFIIAKQVDKSSVDWEFTTLSDSRISALNSKWAVWIVSATLRTIGTLRQMFSNPMFENEKVAFSSMDSLYSSEFKDLKYIKSKFDLKKTDAMLKKFDQLAASHLQKALDAGSSSDEMFNKAFFMELLSEVLINPKEASSVYYEFITPISKAYWAAKMDPSKTYKLAKSISPESAEYAELIHWSTWSKKNLLKYIINDSQKILWGKSSIAWYVNFINNSYDLKFVTEAIVNPSKELKLIIDELSKWGYSPIKRGYILKELRGQYSDFIESIPTLNDNLQNFLALIKLHSEIDNYTEKKSIAHKISELLNWDKLSDDSRSIATLYAMTLGQYDIFNYLTTKQKFDYLTSSDKNFITGMNKRYKIEIPKSYIEVEEMKTGMVESINDLKKQLVEEKVIDNVEIIQHKLNKAEDDYATLIEATKEAKLESDPIVEQSIVIPEANYIPIIETAFEEIDSSPFAMHEMLSQYTDINTTAKSMFKVTIQWMFWKYAPKLLAAYDDIASFMNTKDQITFMASKEHIKQFGAHYFGYKQSIRKQLLNAWVPEKKIDNLSLVIQHSLLGNANKQFHLMSPEDIKTSLTKTLGEYWVANLLDDEKFIKELDSYKTNTLEVVVAKLNEIQRIYGYDINKSYQDQKLDLSIITDFIEMTNADPQFVLKINWIKDRVAFEKYIIANAEAMGLGRPLDATLRTMWNAAYKDMTGLDVVLNFAQGIHYQATYGTISTLFTQNSIIAGLSQIFPNYVELKSFMNSDPNFIAEGNYILNKYNFLDSENVIKYGNRLWMKPGMFEEFVSRVTRDMVEWGSNLLWKWLNAVSQGKLWISRNASMRAWEIVDSTINNMLGFNDWPLEHMRKVVAVKTAMDKLGYKTVQELDNFLELWGKNAEMAFHSFARRNFANSGGWVVSSSPFAKWTMFENAHEYLKTWMPPVDFFVQFGVKSLSYLMWWSFHKMATLIEKEWAFLSAFNQLRLRNYKWAASHFWDFVTYNTMIVNQLALTAWLYLKFQKYERDNDNRISFADFRNQFSNMFVAVLIPLGRHFKAYETWSEFWEWSDAGRFTINSIINQATRLFKQPAFINTMYDRYMTEDSLGRGDMLEAFQYALKQHYTGSIRATWMWAATDIFNTQTNRANLGILWIGWATNADNLFADVMSRRSFVSWKDKWFLGTILSGFTGMFSGDASDISMSVMNDLTKELTENVITKGELAKLFTGGQIGTGPKDYNLTNLVWSGDKISEDDKIAISSLWKNIGYYDYSKINSKWEVELYSADGKKLEISKQQLVLEKQIEKELADMNINIEDVIKWNPSNTPSLMKTLTTLELKTGVKTPLILSTLMNLDYFKNKKVLQESEWQLSWKVSEYWTKYKELSVDRDLMLQRDIMLKYQEHFNLDNTLITNVIENDIIRNNKDLFSKFSWADNEEFLKENIYDLAWKMRLARNAMYNNDTKVSALTTRYSLIFKWIKETETWVKVILQTLKDVEENWDMDAKTKLANQAAMLMSLNKTQYNVLKDNKEFEKLTEKSRKELTNWLYKVSSDTIDFDKKSYINAVNEAAGTHATTRRWVVIKPQSKSFGWARPNFAQQFSPIRDFIPGKEWYLSSDPHKYLAQPSYIPRSLQWFNPDNFPIVQEYIKIMINNLYYGYESKWTIRTGSTDKKLDKTQNTNIKIAKPKKAKATKEFKKFKVAPKVSMWMRPDLPLANYWD
jgi:hypothetical protein